MKDSEADELVCWYAVRTRPKQEARADINLRAWGVETLYPKIRARSYNQFNSASVFITKPLFPRYIFAHFAAKTLQHKVKYTRGVHSIVSIGLIPTRVPDDVIEIIKSQIQESGFVNTGEKFSAGDQVVIKNGPLKCFMGIFEREMEDSDRVMILLTAISYQGHVSIERESVEKVRSSA